MDILKKNLAPISDLAWSEIDEMAKNTLVANLSARKFLDFDGPHGFSYTSINLGRLSMGESPDKNGVKYGIYNIQPLVESRVNFSLKTWELDNIERGAKDISLDSLVEATKKIASFEESAIYNGFEVGGIKGIHELSGGNTIKMDLDNDSILDSLTEAQTRMQSEGVDGNCNLIVNPALWKFLGRVSPGGSLKTLVEKQIGGSVIYSDAVTGALLMSSRGGDAEIIVGQDMSIGYDHHTSDEVFLFLTESFTFRVISPEAIVSFKI
ncbi:MAG: family 1 encapsulin nanocompartment shell protein [Spirochaetales bacterium]|uniref:Family 1 encapsulin nanocompartment shell protein n=1 Tax=Candidatus Thalassospirochaeta sargassi TaxID=3119039 RepID=A0AAJ1ID45_9SPIO|nr:family 1 encapsulin nanocompartment shell protein [Spirochaetales bacterium]